MLAVMAITLAALISFQRKNVEYEANSETLFIAEVEELLPQSRLFYRARIIHSGKDRVVSSSHPLTKKQKICVKAISLGSRVPPIDPFMVVDYEMCRQKNKSNPQALN